MSPGGHPRLLPVAALFAFLVATALSLGKPGLPSSLRGEEAAYLLQTTSLAADGDLRIERTDIERLFAAYPYGGGADGRGILIPVRLDDEAASATIDRPLLYALLAAPWYAVFGVNGPLALNVLLGFLSVAILASFFARLAPDDPRAAGSASLLAVFAVVLSALFPYLFQHHPATLWAALGSLVLLGDGSRRIASRSSAAKAVASGAAFGLLACTLPSAVAILPALLLRVRDTWRRWTLGALAGVAAGLLLAFAGTQAPFADGAEPVEIAIEQPGEWPAEAAELEEARAAAPQVLAAEGGGGLAGLLRDALIERRRGLLPYFPLVLLALGAAAASWRRLEIWQWLLFGGLVVHVLWRGSIDEGPVGGTLLGDPSQAALYPLFFLLLPAIPPLSARLGAYALATLALGPALVSSLGPAAAFGDAQAHARGLLSHLPLAAENVGRAGIYRPMPLGGPPELDARLWWPAYAGERQMDELWLLGGESVQLYLETAAPIDEVSSWRLRNLAPGNVVHLRFAGQSERIAFPDELPPGGQGADIEWQVAEPREIIAPDGEERHLYALRISTRHGFKPSWQGDETRTFYLGAALTFLGPRSHLERDVYAATALGCGAPPELDAGETFQALVRLRNESSEIWNAKGAVRVRLAHRWRRGEKTIEGPREDLSEAVAPGGTWKSWMPTRAPTEPGDYRLVVDLIYENIAYFADRRGEPLCEIDITVGDAHAREDPS